MRKCKKWISFLLIISVLLAAVFGNLFLGQASASAKAKKNVKSVTVMLRGKNITKRTVTLVKGKTAKLMVKINPTKAKNSVKFSSNKKSVAAVSKKGTVKAKKAGTAKVKVTITGKYKKKVTWVRIKVRDVGTQTDSSSVTPPPSPSAPSKPSDTERPSVTETPSQPTTEPSVAETPSAPTTEPSVTETPSAPTTEPSATEIPAQPSDGKVLVTYFSRTGENYGVGVIEKGNTAIIADMIAEQTGGTEFEVATVNAYPDVYSECTAVARQEKEQNARPELKGSLPALDDYDIVFIGYPIWWSDMPMAMYTFLESYDWHGKTVIPFCTHEGSGLSGTESSIRNVCEGAEVKQGLAITGTVAQNNRESAGNTVTEWLRALGM